jgi:hypothetical protein
MTSVLHLFVPSLTGCVLVASLVSAAQLSPVPWQGLEQTGHCGPPRGHTPCPPPGCKSVWRPGTARAGRGD